MTAHNAPKGITRKGMRLQLRDFTERDKFKRTRKSRKQQ